MMRQFSGIAVFVLGLIIAGCGGGAQEEGGLSGRVRVDGSSTVFPITEAVAEEFMRANRGVRVSVNVSGTGGGFEKFMRGETSINNASRPITPSEIQLARENNVQFIELPIASDGLAVVVNPTNDWLDCLTAEELRRIWEPDSEVETWSDIRPEWPDESISLYGPGTSSGTYDYFTEAIVGESGASRTDFTASEDDNVLVQGVSGDEYSLGFFGLAYYENNEDRLKVVAIDDGNPDNGEGCIDASTQTVKNGTYQPLARPLFIYVNATDADEPTIASFVNFYLENVADFVGDVGYIPLSDEAYSLAEDRFDNQLTGTLFDNDVDPVGVNVEQLLRKSQKSATQEPEAE